MLLNQVIALVKGEKSRAENAFTKAFRDAGKTEPLTGIARTYEPKAEDGDMYPSEGNRVQYSAETLLNDAERALSRLFDLTATLENGNTGARANVSIDGAIILLDVPVTYLLFLEKKLVDLITFVQSLPVLDPSVRWTPDPALGEGIWRSEETKTVKNKKILRNHVKAEATDKHPAQVEIFPEDVLVGYWTTTKFSGALPATRVAELIERVRKLQDAVKAAREKANSVEVEDAKYASKIFGYLFS